MRILIAPDKYKGSLAAREVAENIALGIWDVLPKAEIEVAPVADGGEGTAEILRRAFHGESVSSTAHDALGRAILTSYVWVEKDRIAVIEMSEAAGLQRIRFAERDPGKASTFGVGEMITEAIGRDARQIIVGLGGSATNDGGTGMARALGFRFFAGEKELTNGPVELVRLTRIIRPQRSAWPQIVAAVDVRNPLLGEQGATRVFAGQKGATPEQAAVLEQGLRKLADAVTRDLGCDFRNETGAGAAGGLGFGLMSFCRAQLQAGFELIADTIGLEQKIQASDVVITGEGRLDMQTAAGKAPAGVAMLARKLGKPVYAIVGEMTEAKESSALFERVFELVQPRISRDDAMKGAGALLRERAAELARALQ
jgi:glycerate 2-kinase